MVVEQSSKGERAYDIYSRLLKERKSEFRHFYQNIVDLFIENEKEIRSFIQSKKAKKNKTLKNN